MRILQTTALLALIVFLSGCTTLGQIETPKQLSVSFSEPNRIKFQGKGAGAGMALMSTMGPMGIAIGAAIDEGIAKDISKAATSEGFNIERSLKNAITKASGATYQANFMRAQGVELSLSLKVIRYGFKTTGGANDATSAEIEAEFIDATGDVVSMHFPNDFKTQEGFELKTYPLERLKSEGQLSVELLDDALEQFIAKYLLEPN